MSKHDYIVRQSSASENSGVQAKHVRFGIVLRMVAWGGLSGIALGALYPWFAVVQLWLLTLLSRSDANTANSTMLNIWLEVGCIFGLLLGGIAGLILGLIDGTVLATLTYRIFDPADTRHYRKAVEITCIVVGGLFALLLVLASGLPQFGARGWGAEWSWLVWGVIPTLIATAATWWAGRNLATWVSAMASKNG